MLTLPDLKARLNITTAGSDGELADLLEAAVAEWEQWVGPLVDPVPANVRELILLDAAGLYASTQRGSSARTFMPDEGEAGRPPMALFPRIRAAARVTAARIA